MNRRNTLLVNLPNITPQLRKAQKIFVKDLEDPSQVLREVDIFGLVVEMRPQTKEDLWYTMSMGFEQCDCADTQSRCKHMLALKKIVDKSYYNVLGVIKDDIFCMHNAIYEELPPNEEEIRIVRTLETVNDDDEFYKEIEDLQKSLESFNIGALSINQKKICEQSSNLRK